MTSKIIDSNALQEITSILFIKFQLSVEIESIDILTNEGRRNIVARIALIHISSKMGALRDKILEIW